MIKAEKLTKKYGDNYAIRDISFEIEPGHIYGFLGPNGAGKSTTLNIIAGCLAQNSGKVSLSGLDLFEKPIEYKKHIGFLPEVPPLYKDMTPKEFLSFVAEARGVDKSEIAEHINKILAITDITDVQNRLISTLSKGYCQRVAIASAIVSDPDVIILDEPTVGLDPKQMKEIRTLITRLGEDHTVIFSSHILSEVSSLCDRLIIISNGRIVANDTIDNIIDKYNDNKVLKILFRSDIGKLAFILEKHNLNDYKTEESEKYNSATVNLPHEFISSELLNELISDGIEVIDYHIDTVSLEDIFFFLTDNDNQQLFESEPEDTSVPESDNLINEEDSAEYTPVFSDETENTDDEMEENENENDL